MDDLTLEMQRIIAAKERRRVALAALPYPEKVRILLQLQRMAAPIQRSRGREVRPWPESVIAPARLEDLLVTR